MSINQVIAQRYQIIAPIGEGGMALVYLARDLRTDHDVAIKFLRPEFKENPDFLSRFQREANAASKMSHHNIVNLLDVGEDTNNPFIVIEYVNGKTLKDIIRDSKTLPQDVSVQIAIRILSALQHAHQAGIIHRDIKPQNILVNQKGYIKVSDFGIARMVGSKTATMAETDKSVMGTVHYFSPEQAQGETATVSSDLYSVGIVLYEMLTGTVPFDGDTPVAIALQHIQAKPKPLRELNPDISPSVENVVMKALEKNPHHRYHTALEMAQALKIALQSPEKESTLDTPIITLQEEVKPARGAQRKHIRNRERAALLALSAVILGMLVWGSVLIIENIISSTKAPYILDLQEDAAIREAKKAGLNYCIVRQPSSEDVGTVILQSHDYDYPMKRGDTLLITVSSGDVQQEVPSLVNLNIKKAQEQAERIGLKVFEYQRISNPKESGTVLSQMPQAGKMLDFGGIIQVVISGGEISVPDYSGQVFETIKSGIIKVGLVPTVSDEVLVEDAAQNGRVATQFPKAGEKVMQGTKLDVVIYVTKPSAENTP
ncbi:MAG: Stk1 family PASTA domain-containing Ser/Thr kinase [Clostridiales bacterium]|nr:Stk1 family PASTA domain-containing Ser/Thr kinase [Clostridiales bacterium]